MQGIKKMQGILEMSKLKEILKTQKKEKSSPILGSVRSHVELITQKYFGS